jgi:hypothetical protein
MTAAEWCVFGTLMLYLLTIAPIKWKRRLPSLSPCGRGCLREAMAGEGSRPLVLKHPLIRHGLRPRHLLPQGEKEESNVASPLDRI